MTDEAITALMFQHTQLLQQMNVLWIAFVILVFIQVLGLFVMFGVAAWSVARVTSASTNRIDDLQNKWLDHSRKWDEMQAVVVTTLGGMKQRGEAQPN